MNTDLSIVLVLIALAIATFAINAPRAVGLLVFSRFDRSAFRPILTLLVLPTRDIVRFRFCLENVGFRCRENPDAFDNR